MTGVEEQLFWCLLGEVVLSVDVHYLAGAPPLFRTTITSIIPHMARQFTASHKGVFSLPIYFFSTLYRTRSHTILLNNLAGTQRIKYHTSDQQLHIVRSRTKREPTQSLVQSAHYDTSPPLQDTYETETEDNGTIGSSTTESLLSW